MTEPSSEEIARVVLDTLKGDFASVDILDVKILERVEDEDGTLLRIAIVFEGTPKDLDARKMSGAVRHVRPKLAEIGEDAFPLFSFVTRADARHLAPA
jgi:hypothetical protein